VNNYDQLLWTRAIMGVSEAFYIPAALALIADYHLGPTRSRAIGLHQMGIYIGVIIGGFAGYAADEPSIGWRGAFAWCGLLGIAYSVPLFLFLRNRPATTEAVAQPAAGSTVRALLGNPSFLLLVVYFTLPAMAAWVVRDWMPDILSERFNLGQGKAGVSAVLYWQLAAIVGAVLGGWLADRWMRTNIRGRIFVSAIGTFLLLPALFGVGNASTLLVAVLFLIVFGLGWGFFDCNSMPILCQLVGPEYRATGYGLMNFVSISCGGFADWIFGALRDRQMPLNAIFGVFAGIALLSIFVALCIKPREHTPS
jgi:MFS family permease